MTINAGQGVSGIQASDDSHLKIYGGNISVVGGKGSVASDGKPGIIGFSEVEINGGIVYANGGDGGDKMPSGKMAPGPAFKVGSLKAADDILLKDGADAATATNIVYASGEELASKVTGRYARFVTPNYLTFTAQTSGSTIKFAKSSGKNLMINTNGEWVAYADSDLITLANAGDKVQFKGKGVQTLGEGGKRFAMTGRIGASGSVTSLTDENGGDPDVTLTSGCYAYLFKSCAALTSLPDLPAMNLAAMCYGNMFNGCSCLAVNTNATEGSKLWFVPASQGVNLWNDNMFKDTAGNFTGAPALRTAYYVAAAEDLVSVFVPEVAGATAQLYAFDVNGGWLAVAADEVPSNAMVRVVWTADDDKGLTGEGAANAYQWQTEFGPVTGGEEAPAPTVGESGESVISIDLDTRADKTYFRADDILPVWYAAGVEVKVQGQGQQSWETLVKNAANTNTVAWTPEEPDAYTLSHPEFVNATITLTTPVEVTTNDLEVAGTTVQVTDDGGQPLVAQTEEPFAGKIIVPSNSTVKVVYTATGAGVYFADGSTTYVAEFTADKSVNAVSEAVTKPEEPAAPSVKLGVVAQRYPWDGNLDVQYKATNVPAGQYNLVLKVNVGGVVKGKVYGGIVAGVVGTVVYDLKAYFGEVTTKKCRVSATLKKSN